jgi:adenylate cyclase
VFVLQDEITLKIIDNLQMKLIYGEQARLWEGMTKNIRAYDLFMRGNECIHRNNEKDNKQARRFYKEAINIDREFAFAYTMLGFTHFYDLAYGWSKSQIKSFEEAEKSAEKAHVLNDSLDLTHSLLGMIYLFKKQHEQAMKSGERAVELNPNGANAHFTLGMIFCYSGKIELAIELLKRAFRLNPIPPSIYYSFSGTAYRINRQYEKAIELSEKCLSSNPDQIAPYITLAASYISLNRIEEARKAAKEVLRIHANFSLEYFGNTMPYKNQEIRDELIKALRKAGLPD